ncbi:DUF5455 family protein [Azotobacter chroococcum]|uniref:DUF5455 family protein n=1 Tax=Azotobacter chroococcum TaxID=353 RepID=UPI00058519E4|nr:DUF5455 family protein [Azotobacter chroococcum]
MPFIIGFLKRLIPVFFARLSAYLLGLFGAFVGPATTAAAKFSSRLSRIAMVVAAIGAAIGVFSVAVSLALDGLSAIAPDEFLAVGRMFFPSNLNVCIAVLVFARLKSLVFFWVVRVSEKFEHS